MPRFVGWVEARNPTNTLGFASLKRQVLQRREPPQRTGSPTYKKMAKVLIRLAILFILIAKNLYANLTSRR